MDHMIFQEMCLTELGNISSGIKYQLILIFLTNTHNIILMDKKIFRSNVLFNFKIFRFKSRYNRRKKRSYYGFAAIFGSIKANGNKQRKNTEPISPEYSTEDSAIKKSWFPVNLQTC